MQQIELEYPGVKSVSIATFAADLDGFAFVAKNITAYYSLTNLSIDRIEVESLQVRQTNGEASNTDSDFIEQSLATLENVWQQIPVKGIKIVRLDYSSVDESIQAGGSIDMSTTNILTNLEHFNSSWYKPLSGEINLNRNGEAHAELIESGNPQNGLVFTARIPDQTFNHHLMINTEGYSLSTKGSGTWSNENLTLYLAPGTSAALSGTLWDSADSSLAFNNSSHTVEVTTDFHSFRIANGPYVSFEMAAGMLNLQLEKLNSNFEFRDIHFNGKLQFKATDQSIESASLFSASLQNQSLLHLSLSRLADQSFLDMRSSQANSTVELLTPLNLFVDIGSQALQTQPTQLRLTSNLLQDSSITIETEDFEGIGDQLLNGNVKLTLDKIGLTIPAQFAWEAPTLNVHFNFDHTINIPPLSNLNLADNLEFQGGRLHGNGELNWHQNAGALNVKATTNAENLSGYYADYQFAEVAGIFQLSLDETGEFVLQPSNLTNAYMDLGFPVNNISGEISFDSQQLIISELSANLLGGRIDAPLIRYQRAAETAQFDIQASNLSLDAILALEGDQISGTGTLDGVIPISIVGGEITVSGGQFDAQSPGGVIHYRDAAQAAISLEEQGFGFAIGALDNFNYTTLATKVNYAASGDLNLAIRLEGSNPEIENGREIHYNLNVTENIPALLRSLQLSDDITDQVERHVKP